MHLKKDINMNFICNIVLLLLQNEKLKVSIPYICGTSEHIRCYPRTQTPPQRGREGLVVTFCACVGFELETGEDTIYVYCMKPPNIKAPKCTLFSRVKGRKRSPVLPRLIASIVGGSLLWRAHFESLRVAEAKNAATINRLM